MPPHEDVAQRFRQFLDAVGLSRTEFAKAVDGAIEARSLFSVLNGHRRPSRALAVLIERSWGFRAEFLLEGQGEAWTKPAYEAPSIGGAALAPGEAAVVDFMRTSADNARAMELQLEQAWAWWRGVQQLGRSTAPLEACETDASEADLQRYPLLLRLVVEQLRLLSERQEEVLRLQHRDRASQMLEDLLLRFGREIPSGLLNDAERARLEAVIEPTLSRVREQRAGLLESLDRTRTSLAALHEMGDLQERVAAGHGPSLHSRHRDLLAQLAEQGPSELRDEAARLAADLERERDPTRALATRLLRVIDALHDELRESNPIVTDATSVEALQARYEGLLEPLAG